MADVQFNSVTIPFGKFTTVPHEYALKEWAFPGVDGLDEIPILDGGFDDGGYGNGSI